MLSFWFGTKQKQLALNFTEQVGEAIMLEACIQEVLSLNVNQDMSYSE
jgi:hypothetical protein